MAFEKIITANGLLSGEVVYLTAAGSWSLNIDEAMLWQEGSVEAERLAEMQRVDASVIGPYLAHAIRREDGTTIPSHFREVFRTTGPSNRSLGKQAA